jgi:hypothetical protein
VCVCACLSSITGAGRAAEKFRLAVALSNMRERLLDVVVAIRNHSVNRVRHKHRASKILIVNVVGDPLAADGRGGLAKGEGEGAIGGCGCVGGGQHALLARCVSDASGEACRRATSPAGAVHLAEISAALETEAASDRQPASQTTSHS